MPKSPLLKKRAMDALFETMTTDDYDSLGAHRRGESTPESKGTEFDNLQGTGFMPEGVVIPSQDLAQPPDPANAEFFKESDPRTASFEVEAAVDPRIKIKIEWQPIPPYSEAGKKSQAYRAVATLGGKEVGHLGVRISDDGTESQIGLAEVDDSQRGTGLGQALYDKAIAQARKSGVNLFRSDTSLSPDAHKAWGRLGQRYPVERRREGYSINLKESHDFEDDHDPIIPIEEEMEQHEFVKQSPKQAAPSTSRTQSPEWQKITDLLAKRGYRWLGNVSDGTEMWSNLRKQFFYDPATHTWTHKTDGKLDAQGAIEDLEKGIAKVGMKLAHGSYPDPGQGKYDSAHEAHVREEAKQWSQYAEEADNTEDIKPYDPSGNYLCGTCDMRRGSAACARVEGEISFGTGSCKLYHIGDPEDDAPMPKPFAKKEVKYGEHDGGFGCHRCEYGGEAKQPDMEGREGWCSFWGMHVETNACCAEWDQDDEKDKAAEAENKEVEKARKASVGEYTTNSITGPSTGVLAAEEFMHFREAKKTSKELYHVTRTATVPKILKRGILPLQTSNWVKGPLGERYGEGEIYAMENAEDAVRWAAKMDWDFNKGMGTGKISIVIFDPGDTEWEQDVADPMSQATAKGRWLKHIGAIKPEQIKKAVPVDHELTKQVVQGKGVKLAGPVKSYGMGTPIGGTDNPDAGAEEDDVLDEQKNEDMLMTGSEQEYDPEVEDAAFMAALDAEDEEAEKRACYFASVVDRDDLDVVASKFASSEEISWFSKSARPTPQKIELLQKQFKLTPEQIELCIAADPSPNQSDFVAWIAKFLSKASFQLPEDTERIKDQLEKFQKFKRSPNFLFSKDIQQYDPAKLFETITQAEAAGLGSKKEKQRETVRAGAEIVVQEGDVKIYRVTTPEAARELGSGTNWCTAAPGSGYAATYLKDGPLYIFFDSGSAVAQLHCESNQFMNRADVCILESVTGDRNDRSIKKFLADPGLAKALQILAAKEPNVKEWAQERVADPEDVKKILGEAAEEEIAENTQFDKDMAEYEKQKVEYEQQMKKYQPKLEKWHKQYEEYQQKQNEYQKKLEEWNNQDPSHGTSENPVPFWLDRDRPKAPERPREPVQPRNPSRPYSYYDSTPRGKNYIMQVKHALATGKPLSPEIESKLVDSGIGTDLLLKYASQFHPGQPWEPLATAIMRKVQAGKAPKKQIIDYAVKFLKGRWVEAEPLFLNKMFLLTDNMANMQSALEYATRVVKGRWPEFETQIQKAKPGLASGYGAAEYAIHATKMPWHQMSGIKKKKNGRINAEECMIKGNPGEARKYAEAFFQGKRWEEFETSALEANNLLALINYAKDTLHARMPGLEEKILEGNKDAQEDKGRKRHRRYTDLAFRYAQEVIKGRWPEYEAKILAHFTKPPETPAKPGYSGSENSYEPSKRRDYGYSTWTRDQKFPTKISNYIESIIQNRWPELEQILLARYQQFPEAWVKNQNLVDGYLVSIAQGAADRHKNQPANDDVPDELAEAANLTPEERSQRDNPNKQVSFTKFKNDPSAYWAEGEQRLVTRDTGYEDFIVNELRERTNAGKDSQWTKDPEARFVSPEDLAKMERPQEEVRWQDRDKKPAYTIWNGIWIGYWGMDRLEKYTDYMLANGQSWDLGIDILELKEDLEDVRGRYTYDKRTVRRQPKAQGATASMKYQSSLLKKKALVEMHESPTMLPPRDDIKRHIDEQEQQMIDDDVMLGVKPAAPHQPGQIDPRINPSGRAAAVKTARMDKQTFQKWVRQLGESVKSVRIEPVAGALQVTMQGKPVAYLGFPVDEAMRILEPFLQDSLNRSDEAIWDYILQPWGGQAQAFGQAAASKQADYTDQDWMDDEAAEYQLDQVRDAEREAKRHFMQEDYIQQIADDYIPPKTMEEMWDIMGDEYTAEFYGTPYTPVPDFTDQETEGWEGKRLSSQKCPKCKSAHMEIVDDGSQCGCKTAALVHCMACDSFYTAI